MELAPSPSSAPKRTRLQEAEHELNEIRTLSDAVVHDLLEKRDEIQDQIERALKPFEEQMRPAQKKVRLEESVENFKERVKQRVELCMKELFQEYEEEVDWRERACINLLGSYGNYVAYWYHEENRTSGVLAGEEALPATIQFVMPGCRVFNLVELSLQVKNAKTREEAAQKLKDAADAFIEE